MASVIVAHDRAVGPNGSPSRTTCCSSANVTPDEASVTNGPTIEYSTT